MVKESKVKKLVQGYIVVNDGLGLRSVDSNICVVFSFQ